MSTLRAMPRLSDGDVRMALDDLPGWVLEEGSIRKEFTFKGCRAAIAFIDRVADEAHEARHHPEILNTYNRVVMTLTTHDEGGVTEKDLALARAIESVAEPPEV